MGSTLLSAAYLVIAGTGLYVVVQGLGIAGASFPATLAVYFFSLAFSLILPIPVDVGVLESSGVGAVLAVGVSKNGAVGAMLLNRVLSIVAALASAAVVMGIFHAQFRAALRGRKESQATELAAQGAARAAGEG